MLTLTLIDADDLAHVIARVSPIAGVQDHRSTRCGRPARQIGELTGWTLAQVTPGNGCHVCLPGLAHPLAAVWAQCRRWDDNANADLVRI